MFPINIAVSCLLFPQIQTMVESLKLSITDQQLPMIIRILELIIALYYGEIGGHKEGDGEEHGGAIKETGAALSGESETRWSSIGSFCLNFGLSRNKHQAVLNAKYGVRNWHWQQ